MSGEMASITALQKVLVTSESKPVLSKIIDFAGQDVRLARVNNAFRQAIEYSARQVCKRFTAVSAGADPHPDELTPRAGLPCHQMTAKFLEIEQAHRDWAGAHFLWGLRMHEWPAEWERVRSLMTDIERLPDGPAKNLRCDRLLQELNRLGAEHEEAVNALPAPGGVAGLMGLVPAVDQDPMARPLETLKNIGFDESLQQRFQAAIAPREGRAALDPETRGLQSLVALRAAQREKVELSAGHRLRFDQLPNLHSFAYEDLLQAEKIAHAADWMEGNTVLNIGQLITHERFAGHAPAATVAEWRAWLESPVSARHLQSLQHFYLGSQNIFPRRIDHFSGLRTLSFPGSPENYLTEIPHEIGNLTQLRELQLMGHHIREIPDSLGRLRLLERLFLTGNLIEELPPFLATLPQLSDLGMRGNPIRVLPDALYRHLEPTISFLCSDEEYLWMDIDRQTFTQIPFRLWFRERCMIKLFSPDDRCLLDCILALPVLLINFFLLEIVEPIITFFRDQLGYSRMVEVEPRPQGEEA